MSGPEAKSHLLLRELEFRMAVTTAILSTLDLDQILYVILSGITSGDGLGFNRALLLLDDDSRRFLQVRMAMGPASEEAAHRIWTEIDRHRVSFSALLPRFAAYREDAACQELTERFSSFALPLDRLEAIAASPHALILQSEAQLAAVLARCMVNRSPFCSNALRLNQEVGGSEGQMVEMVHVAIVPLSVGGTLIGAIVADNVFSRTRVDSDRLRGLHAIGNLAALAIDRARLHARTVAMAEVDGLTGVYNRRFYRQRVRQSLELARRGGQPLAVVLFDLDHFKRTNDEHGHLVGDEVLKQVAQLLVQQVRQTDVVARYGGEEFILLLNNTSRDAAVRVAEKLRQRVKETALVDGLVQLTVSAGVTCTSGDESADDLFERADQALYRAKREGRDRVVTG